MPKGIAYAIDGIEVTSPDEEGWTPIVIGDSLSGTQKRSPYLQLEWRKQVASPCRLDWHDYDNRQLASLTTRPPDELDEFETYTDAFCRSVTMRQRLGVATEVVATFWVYVG